MISIKKQKIRKVHKLSRVWSNHQ